MCSHTKSSSVTQTLDELEFERGLWNAAVTNDLHKCQELLKKGQNPSKPDSSGFTPLHYAVRSSSIEIIELLLKSGAKTDLQTNGGKSTALHRACLKGRPEVVQILIDFKCDPNIVDEDGRTALHLCFIDSNHEKLKCAEYLSSITNPDITDKDGRKPNNGKLF